MLFVCESCGENFNAKPSKKRKYCSRSCYVEANRDHPPEQVCAECGTTFTPQSTNQVRLGFGKFCSVVCSKSAERKRTRREFWDNVDKNGPLIIDTPCWEYPGSRDSGGYARVSSEGRRWKAHRLAYTLAKGPIPDGMDALHRCDNPPCCNPDHLFLGDDFDNQGDAVAKGRNQHGERHSKAKLSDPDVLRIRELAGRGWEWKELAESYQVSRRAIRSIVLRETWKHL